MVPEYIVSFNTSFFPVEEVDFLIVGGGIAGLRAAIELKDYNTVIIYKNGLEETTTYNAQGGIAVGIGENDSPENHLEDTIRVGCGINKKEAVKILVYEGIERVKELIDWGINFDKINGKYHFTKEGGHSSKRILHANGDMTGREIIKTLYKIISLYPKIKIFHNFFLIDLITFDDEVRGALILDCSKNSLLIIQARSIILATGGAGQIFQETTNPPSITGDGHSAAYRKGAEFTDLEFFQFHPTTLYIAGAPRFLISEAVRGEGGVLRNVNGEKFMESYHPLGDLAPRDIVARAIVDQMKKTNSNCVFLDVSNIPLSIFKKRFPYIYSVCNLYKIKIPKEPIPVRPSAHYFMGGIRTDLWGRTNLKNLYACGEIACTGVHGANRLASNSLLEGLVFGARVGKIIKENLPPKAGRIKIKYNFPQKTDILIDREDLKRSIRSLMWRNVGIERDNELLSYAYEKLKNWEKYAFIKEFSEKSGFESQNMLILATLIAKSALIRKESRGVHYRSDYKRVQNEWEKHIIFKKRRIFFKKQI